MNIKEKKIKPFVVWAGGKSGLLEQFKNFYPTELKTGEITTYIEPFLGGGAVLIDILQNYNIKNVYAFDINIDLINCYKVIKTNIDELVKELYIKQNDYLQMNQEERKNFFLDIRKEYNSYRITAEETSIKRATEFIVLNKLCYSGLYRVNKKGEFNNSFNNAKNLTICDEKNLRNLSKIFQNVLFYATDYTESIKYIDQKTFIYLDPPYRPLTKTTGFTKYTKDGFTDSDQVKLCEFYKSLNCRNIKLMLSNSDPKNDDPTDNFFEELYKNFYINKVNSCRRISKRVENRGKITELLITNYKGDQDYEE